MMARMQSRQARNSSSAATSAQTAPSAVVSRKLGTRRRLSDRAQEATGYVQGLVATCAREGYLARKQAWSKEVQQRRRTTVDELRQVFSPQLVHKL